MKARITSLVCLLVIIAAVLFSCKKTINEVYFTKNFDDKTFVIDTTVNAGVGVKLLGAQVIDTDLRESLEGAGFNINNLKSAEVFEISLETVDPTQSLNYFNYLEIRLNSLGAEQVIFASASLPDETTDQLIEFTPSDLQLQQFFKDEEVTFSFYGTTDQNITSPVEMRFSMKFRFRAALGN